MQLPLALDRVSVTIRGSDRVGICGRTGSGKSTITMVLFRMVEVRPDLFRGDTDPHILILV